MANKRMFSRDVVDGSRFIMLPHSAQNLYFHLGMHADDDGYCEYVSVIRLIAGSNSDLRILQENGFICVYNLYTLCIQDWYTHNKIAPSRYSESKYLKTFPERDLPLESQYNPPLEPCIQSVHKVYEESSIGKVRLGKVSKEKKQAKKEIELPDWLDKKAWSEFVQHRKDIRKPLTPLSAKKALNVLERNKDHQQEIVDATICNRWTGLFDYKPNGKLPKESLADRQMKKLQEAYPDDN